MPQHGSRGGIRLVASFAASFLAAYTSFPQRRESILQPSGVLGKRIPAFAGTAGGMGTGIT